MGLMEGNRYEHIKNIHVILYAMHVRMFFSIQIDIYDTYEDLLLSCDENDTPPTTGCLAFVRNTRFIYIQLSEEDCEWIPWVSGIESGQVWHISGCHYRKSVCLAHLVHLGQRVTRESREAQAVLEARERRQGYIKSVIVKQFNTEN